MSTKNAVKLKALTSDIREADEVIYKTLKMTLDQALHLGSLLNEAKDLVPRGKWGRWVKDNCSRSHRQANKYMKMAKSEYTPNADMNISAAYDAATDKANGGSGAEEPPKEQRPKPEPNLLQEMFDAIHTAMMSVKECERSEMAEAVKKRLSLYTENQNDE